MHQQGGRNATRDDSVGSAAADPYAAESASRSADKEQAGKLVSLPPAKVCLPKGVRIVQISTGLHHTLLLAKTGEVYAFGSNSYGQLGTGIGTNAIFFLCRCDFQFEITSKTEVLLKTNKPCHKKCEPYIDTEGTVRCCLDLRNGLFCEEADLRILRWWQYLAG